MKPTFHHNPVNGPFEDPCLYVRLLREKRALLFDAGELGRLSQREILKVSDVFITHAHVDHFIGFDTVLRALLRREKPLRVFGPANIIDCVEGKLRGYTWNLISEYPLRLEVHAVNGNVISHSSFSPEDNFSRKDADETQFSGTLLKDPFFEVKAVELDHDTPCLAFSLEEEYHINIDKAALTGMGLPVGPWLSELKRAIREDLPDETEINLPEKTYKLGELRGIAMITRGQKVTYVTDASLNDNNLRKITEFARGSDTLYCEAYFLDEDRDKALERNHLTAKAAGRLAREAGVGDLQVMHFSPKYRNSLETPLEEAMEEFQRGSKTTANAKQNPG
jgi:ribonuclease Z